MRRLVLLIFMVLLPFSAIGAEEEPILDVPGRIAYIGDDFNVYSLSLHDGGIIQLTDDGNNRRRYQWPTWADNGKLAYFCCQPSTGRIFTDIYVSPDGIEPGEVIYSGDGEAITYSYWAPRDCDEGENCRVLAVLLNQGGFFSVNLFRNTIENTTEQIVGIGAPFYYSWSPDSTQMLMHRNNRRLEIYNVTTEAIRRLDQSPGAIQSPAWSPVDDRLLFGSSNEENTTDLMIVANEEVQLLQPDIPGIVSYSWSPDGNYVAFRTLIDGSLGGISVLDTVTGESVAQTFGEDVYAFFWSPDSQRIAYVALATPEGSFSASNPTTLISESRQGGLDLAWGVLDVEDDSMRRYGTFVPTSEMVYLLNFFDQFAQSHQVWSPDSTHIVFSEITEAGEPTITVLDMTRPNAVPFAIGNGYLGIWSYR